VWGGVWGRGRAGVGRRLTMNLGPQIFAWGKEKKKPSSVNGISKYLLLCSRLMPQGDIWRKEKKKKKKRGQIKIKRQATFCSFAFCKDTKQTRGRIRMRPCVVAASRKL
jgi:hypothetical protein